MDTFKDWEPADSYASASAPDPLQVARRIHEDRGALEFLAGRELAPWPQLTWEEQEFAVDVARGVIDALARDFAPTAPALYLHSTLYALGETKGWTQITDEERTLAMRIMEKIVDWLALENSKPESVRRR